MPTNASDPEWVGCSVYLLTIFDFLQCVFEVKLANDKDNCDKRQYLGMALPRQILDALEIMQEEHNIKKDEFIEVLRCILRELILLHYTAEK